MEPVTMPTLKPGDRVVVPWGLEDVRGTVLSLFGPPGKQYARLEVELSGDDNLPMVEALTLPVSLLQRTDAA
ncbi:MAG: hypothetical protein ACRDZ8_01075 [Acidimicrobiales bacterium]